MRSLLGDIGRAPDFDVQSWSDALDFVIGYATTLTRSRADRDDLLQEMFLRLLEETCVADKCGVGTPLHDAGAFRRWAATVMRNLVIDHQRKSDSFERNGSSLGAMLQRNGVHHDPCDAAMRADDARRLLANVERLPVDWRDAIVLHYLDELTFDELSVAMKRSVNAVRLLLTRAKRRLRRLQSEGSGEGPR